MAVRWQDRSPVDRWTLIGMAVGAIVGGFFALRQDYFLGTFVILFIASGIGAGVGRILARLTGR
jgi:hypothetical protein